MSNLEDLFSIARPAPSLIMGILNVTPDSFSDGGKFTSPECAAAWGIRLAEEGAQIIDVGGEATGPQSKPLPVAKEIARVEPVVRALCEARPINAEISVDTFHAQTAEACLKLGARIVNDISALRAETEMARIIKDFDAYVVIMHSKEADKSPHASSSPRHYKNVIQEVGDFLASRIEYALSNGIAANRIIIDPGMGRFLSVASEVSWALLFHLDVLTQRFPDFPLLIGASRKGFLGGKYQGTDAAERDVISQLTSLWASIKGARILRTHNVSQLKNLLQLWGPN